MSEKITETMLTYIEECPELIKRNVANSVELTKPLVDEFCAGDYRTIWLVASGSSANGSYCARNFLRNFLKVEVKVVTPFNFIHAENDFGDNDFIFAISQSGYSTNTIEAIEIIKAKGRKSIAVTMDSNSDIKNYADLVVNYGIGFEKVGYVTKGVTGLALFLMLFAVEAGVRKGIIDAALATDLKADIEATSAINAEVLAKTKNFYEENFLALSSIGKTFLLGLGAGYGVATEGALKISETVQIPAMPLEAEEYLHGITLQINPRQTTFLIDVGVASERIAQIYEANKLATPNSYLITINPKYQEEKTAVYVNTNVRPEVLSLGFLPFVQYTAFKITDDNHRWDQHPAFKRMNKAIAAKTKNYETRSE